MPAYTTTSGLQTRCRQIIEDARRAGVHIDTLGHAVDLCADNLPDETLIRLRQAVHGCGLGLEPAPLAPVDLDMGMHVVLLGNIVDGIRIFGPFRTGSEAWDWADTTIEDDEWVIAPLRARMEYGS